MSSFQGVGIEKFGVGIGGSHCIQRCLHFTCVIYYSILSLSQGVLNGYDHPTKPLTQFSPNPPPTHTKPPQGSQLLTAPLAPSHHHHHHHHQNGGISSPPSSHREDDELSILSSEGGSGGSYSSYDSMASEKKPSLPHNSPSRQSAAAGYASQRPKPREDPPRRASLMSREPSLPPRSRDTPPRSYDATSRDREFVSPPASGSEDYTQQIRYPNQSQILVQPLLDEDIGLKSGNVGVPKSQDPIKSGGSKEPFYCDRSRFDFHQRQHEKQRRSQGSVLLIAE